MMMRSICSLALTVLFAGAAGACGSSRAEPAADGPPPVPPIMPTVVIPSPPIHRAIQVCVVQGGELTMVTAQLNTVTGDTVFRAPGSDWGGPTEPFVLEAAWFLENEPIAFDGHRYVRYSTPRVVGIEDIARAGEYRGVPVFTDDPLARPPEILYVPLRDGCVFQPYQVDYSVGAVRG